MSCPAGPSGRGLRTCAAAVAGARPTPRASGAHRAHHCPGRAATGLARRGAAGPAARRDRGHPGGRRQGLRRRHVVVTQPTAGKFVAFSATCTHRAAGRHDHRRHRELPVPRQQFALADGSVVTGPATARCPRRDQGLRRADQPRVTRSTAAAPRRAARLAYDPGMSQAQPGVPQRRPTPPDRAVAGRRFPDAAPRGVARAGRPGGRPGPAGSPRTPSPAPARPR